MANRVPAPGDSRTVNNVVFTAQTEEKYTARSIADTAGDDPVDVHLGKDGTLTATPEGKSLPISADTWEEFADRLKEEDLNIKDRYREAMLQHQRDFDALPRYHSGRKVGNAVLNHTSKREVVRARSISDSDGSKTGLDLTYVQEIIQVGEPGALAKNWDEAIKRLAQIFDAYEADLKAVAERKQEFVDYSEDSN